ncbi:MAG: methyltransferase domain-containing protein [Candidatus Cloacimonetes bacterium]|nr:methyltransferase domain-containing protein [Candidatus Cloacimonadota bacterium]
MIKQTDNDPRNVRRLYNDLAHLWHLVSPLDDYLEETEIFCDILEKKSEIPVSILLHLGCGRGHNDFIFKQHYEVTGVDISPTMLQWAKVLNPEVEYIQGDMRTVQLDKKFDAVVAIDSVDYLVTEVDLKRLFNNAFDHLREGGIFMFILESIVERFKQNDTIMYSNHTEDEFLTVIENRFDPDVTDSEYEATFIYLYRQKGKLEILTDRHLCGLYSIELVRKLLHEAGFVVEIIEYRPPESALGNIENISEETYPLFIASKTQKINLD